MPDVGVPPSPPPEVMSQMQPSIGSGQGIAQMMGGGGGGFPTSDITPKVMNVEPLLNDLALEVPALAPDIDNLLAKMKAKMGGVMAGLLGMAGLGGALGGGMPGGGALPPEMMAPDGGLPPEQPLPGGMPSAAPPMGGGIPPSPGPMDPMAAEMAAAPAVPTNAILPPPPEQGPMDIAIQLEAQLPSIAADDETLAQPIQYFIAKMREEVSKVLSGAQANQTDTLLKNPAPTNDMLKSIPVMA